jgi:3-hydroxyisobutyrate dehydrogenase-like beta-hydroxyacid dehydrogenase
MFGRPEAAAAAKLELPMAGAPALLDKVEPVLGVLGCTWRMGDDPHLSYLTKIAGNFMIACAVQAMAEGAAPVSSRGGDPEPFLALMSETLFPAPIYRKYAPAVARGVSPGTPIGPRAALKAWPVPWAKLKRLGYA